MTESRKEPAKIVAYIMLAVNVLTLLYFGYVCAHHDAMHYSFWSIEPSKVGHLTLKEDVLLDYQVHVPKGTVVYPTWINSNRIGFYFKASGEYIRKDYEKQGLGDLASEVPETKEYLLNAKPEYFVEYSELERLFKEAENQTRAKRSEVFWNDYLVIILAAVFLFAVLFLLTTVLSKKSWYVILYVINLILFFIIYICLPGMTLYH